MKTRKNNKLTLNQLKVVSGGEKTRPTAGTFGQGGEAETRTKKVIGGLGQLNGGDPYPDPVQVNPARIQNTQPPPSGSTYGRTTFQGSPVNSSTTTAPSIGAPVRVQRGGAGGCFTCLTK